MAAFRQRQPDPGVIPTMTDTSYETQWFPVAGSGDLPFRHVYHGELLGQELAVWRADDGFVNIWENRCLHRGVRLSLGLNLGQSLRCQYHGWTYASRTSGCIYIPAHPENAPARLICNKVFASAERHGLVWSNLKGSGDLPAIDRLEGRDGLTMRPIPVSAPASTVVDALQAEGMQRDEEFALRTSDGGESLFVQPVSAARAIIRGIAHAVVVETRLDVLQQWNTRLSRLRDRCEALAGGSA